MDGPIRAIQAKSCGGVAVDLDRELVAKSGLLESIRLSPRTRANLENTQPL
jgi:hypothetical protein